MILEGPYWAEEPVRMWRAAGLSVMSGLVNDPAVLARVLAFEPEHIATDRRTSCTCAFRPGRTLTLTGQPWREPTSAARTSSHTRRWSEVIPPGLGDVAQGRGVLQIAFARAS